MPRTAVTHAPKSLNLTGDLKGLLEAARGKADGWLRQRDAIAGELTTIRDTAQHLLSELIGSTGPSPDQGGAPTGPKRPGRRPGFKLSAAAKRKIAKAAKQRWATRKAHR